jgi:hypothetical protein
MAWGQSPHLRWTTPCCPPNDTAVIPALGIAADNARALKSALRCGDPWLSPIHSTYYDYYFSTQPFIERAPL